MTLRHIQKALLNSRMPAKIYTTKNPIVLKFRVRWRDRHRVKDVLEPLRPLGYTFKYRPTLMPWECRDLCKVVSYVD